MPSISFRPDASHPWSFQRQVEHSVNGDGSTLSFKTLGKTDWWRGPTVDSTSGAVYGFPLPNLFEGEHRFSVGLGVDYQVQVSLQAVFCCVIKPVAEAAICLSMM
jgi:hypothetical protein